MSEKDSVELKAKGLWFLWYLLAGLVALAAGISYLVQDESVSLGVMYVAGGVCYCLCGWDLITRPPFVRIEQESLVYRLAPLNRTRAVSLSSLQAVQPQCGFGVKLTFTSGQTVKLGLMLFSRMQRREIAFMLKGRIRQHPPPRRCEDDTRRDSLFRKKSSPELRNKDRFLTWLSGSEDTDFGRVDFHEQSFDQQFFSAVRALQGMVNQDGFAAYLEYDSDSLYFAVEALRAIGASKAAKIVRKALDVVAGHPRDQGLVHVDQADLSAWEQEALEELRCEFCAYSDDLTGLLFDFVAARPESFGPVPDLE